MIDGQVMGRDGVVIDPAHDPDIAEEELVHMYKVGPCYATPYHSHLHYTKPNYTIPYLTIPNYSKPYHTNHTIPPSR